MMNESIFIELTDNNGCVQGYCTDKFRVVLDEFVKNFEARGEVGASIVLTHEGETVVDLWGGRNSQKNQKPWTQDTLSMVFSSTKGIVALVANVLIAQGLLDPFQPVAEIWPEYAVNGKQKTTVRMLLDHTAGVPVLREPVKVDGFCDWEYMCNLLSQQAPYWEPGSKVGYHGMTFGWAVGELIRRITGKSVGTNIQEIISQPLGVDLWCGLPETYDDRVAPMIPPVYSGQRLDEIFVIAQRDAESIPGKFLRNDGGWMTNRRYASRLSRASEVPAGSCVTNARGLAGAYRPFALGGVFQGYKLVCPETLRGMGDISSATSCDQTMRIRTAWSLGFVKRVDNSQRSSDAMQFGIGCGAFGHMGAGGSFGFADPREGLSFGYTMNNMGMTLTLTDRGQSLVDASYQSLGYSRKVSGWWLP